MGNKKRAASAGEGPPEISQEPGFARWPLVAALLATFGLAVIGALSPNRRLWGLNHLAFYPVSVRLVALAIVAVSFVPSVGRLVNRGIMKATFALSVHPGLRRWIAPLVAAAAVAVFIGFHSSTLLLGDGRLVASTFGASTGGGEQTVTVDPGGILLGERFAKGASLLHNVAARLSVSVFGGTAIWGIRAAAALLGGILVLVLVRVVMGSRLSSQMRAWLLALALASGAMEIFFGYVENYALLLVSCTLYLLCGLALAARRTSGWIWLAVLCMALGIFAHIQAVVFLPSMVFLAALAWATRSGRPIPRRLDLIIVAAAVACGLALGSFTTLGRYLLPLAGGGAYGVFSSAHLADLANEILLLVPAGILVLAAALATPGVGRSAVTDADSPGERDQRRFLTTAMIPVLGLTCLVRPDLGAARDWDLFSIAAIPLIGVAAVVLRRLETRVGANNLGPVLVPGLALTVVMTGAWIGVNSSADRSFARFEAILRYDSSRTDYAHEVLAAEYHDRGQIRRAEEVLEEALAGGGPPRLAVKLSSYYEEEGRKSDAIRLLRDTLKRDERSERARYHLIRLLLHQGAYDELRDLARQGTLLHPDKAFFRYSYGRALLMAGQTQTGLAELRECLRLNPPEDVSREIERLLK